MGVPLVSTTVAIEGMAVVPGEDLLLADDAPGFAAAVVRLLEDDERGWWPYAVGACAAGLVGLTALYGVYGAIP